MSFITINKLTKKMGNTVQLPPIDLEIKKGACIAIKCNKDMGYTLIKLLLKKDTSSGGEIRFSNEKIKIGTSLLEDELYDRLTVKQYLTFFSSLYGVKADLSFVLETTSLLDKVTDKISSLTFSEKRRLHLARSIIHHPDFVILQEPEQNTDVHSSMIIRRFIKELPENGYTVLVITSNLEEAISVTGEVYRMDETGIRKVNSGLENTNEVQEPEIEEMTNHPLKLEKVPAKINEKIILFDPMEIYYIESSEGISSIHLADADEEYPCMFTLNELDKKLKPYGFYRCHRSYIVNLQKVREVITWSRNSYSLILDNKKASAIPLSKARLDELKEIMGF